MPKGQETGRCLVRLAKLAATAISLIFGAALLARSGIRSESLPSEKRTIRRGRWVLLTLAAGGAFIIVGGALFVWSGVYDVGASSGHFPPLRDILHYAMKQSVAYHASGKPVPPLDDPGLLLLGAAHFHTGCAPCHGAPGNTASPIELGATPPPPSLYDTAQQFSPNEIHWIVKHGIKMTAMPAWPSQRRGDEVWALVAFLEKLPQLDAQKYRQLAIGPGKQSGGTRMKTGLPALKEPPPVVRETCARCHGLDGQGRVGAVPNIAGLNATYIYQALSSFADGARPSGFMGPVASRLTDADKRTLADYFSKLPREQKRPTSKPTVADLVLGEQIARFGAHGSVPGCVFCHARETADRSPGIPQLEGQSVAYIEKQLHLFRTGVRANTPNAKIMSRLAKRLSQEDIRAVAAYLARLRPESTTASATSVNDSH